MNANKSLVIATGYRKKFVDIKEILKNIPSTKDDISVSFNITVEGEDTPRDIGMIKVDADAEYSSFDSHDVGFVFQDSDFDEDSDFHPQDETSTPVVSIYSNGYIYSIQTINEHDYKIIGKFEVNPDIIYRKDEPDGGTMWFSMEYLSGDEYANIPGLRIYPIYTKRVTRHVVTDGDDINVSLTPTIYHIIDPNGRDIIFNVTDYDLYRYTPIVGRLWIYNGVSQLNFQDTGIYLTEDTVTLEEGHDYEYNIFDGICNIIDVTPDMQ